MTGRGARRSRNGRADPFGALGLPPDRGLTDDDVRAAWRRIATATHPDRAERIARSFTDESFQSSTLADFAKALAATDPDRAERIAGSIRDHSLKATVLAEIATALAATDPDHAARLIAYVENIARPVIGEVSQDYV